MSVAPPNSRGWPSKSKGPLAALGTLALIAGDPASSWKSPAAALAKNGGAPCVALEMIRAPLPDPPVVTQFEWSLLKVVLAPAALVLGARSEASPWTIELTMPTLIVA